MTGIDSMQGPLADLAFAALDEAVDRVRLDGRPLVPFTMTDGDSGRAIDRFDGGTRHEKIARGRARLASCGTEIQRCALAYDGMLTIGGTRADAVFVEAHESGSNSSILLAQRFRPGGRLVAFRTIGDPTWAGTVAPLMTDVANHV